MQNDLTEMRTQITALQSELTRLKPQKVDPPVDAQKDLVTELKAQISQLQSHLATLTPNPPRKKSNPPKANAKTNSKVPEQTPLTSQAAKSRPKPGYCFQCGEDGHIASVCPNDPNPSLVTDKRKQLKEKQLLWDRQNKQTQPLN